GRPRPDTWTAALDLADREGEPEIRSVPLFALDPDLAAVHLDDLPRDGKPEPGADDLARGLFVAFIPAEQPVHELGRDADAVVVDAHLDDTVSCQARDGDVAAVGRVLDLVVEKVGEKLGDAVL